MSGSPIKCASLLRLRFFNTIKNNSSLAVEGKNRGWVSLLQTQILRQAKVFARQNIERCLCRVPQSRAKKRFAWESGCGILAGVGGSDPSQGDVQKCPGPVEGSVRPGPWSPALCPGSAALSWGRDALGQLLIRTLIPSSSDLRGPWEFESTV